MSDRRPEGEAPKQPAGSGTAPGSDDAQLRARLGQLSRQLDERSATPGGSREPASAGRGTRGWAQAMRLSSEFIAGILVGGGIGWAIDWAFGWSPFGLITFVLLGFAAGVLNVLRAMGEIPEPGGRRPEAGDRKKTD
jgi:ATP synthase protein I